MEIVRTDKTRYIYRLRRPRSTSISSYSRSSRGRRDFGRLGRLGPLFRTRHPRYSVLYSLQSPKVLSISDGRRVSVIRYYTI